MLRPAGSRVVAHPVRNATVANRPSKLVFISSSEITPGTKSHTTGHWMATEATSPAGNASRRGDESGNAKRVINPQVAGPGGRHSAIHHPHVRRRPRLDDLRYLQAGEGLGGRHRERLQAQRAGDQPASQGDSTNIHGSDSTTFLFIVYCVPDPSSDLGTD